MEQCQRRRSKGNEKNEQGDRGQDFPFQIDFFILEYRRMAQADHGDDQRPEKPALPVLDPQQQ